MAGPYRKPIPTHVRSEVYRRDGGRCHDCGETRRLELHHVSYQSDRPDRHECFGYETSGQLVALCRECHRNRHVDRLSDFWRDPEEMDAYWYTFNEQMELL